MLLGSAKVGAAEGVGCIESVVLELSASSESQSRSTRTHVVGLLHVEVARDHDEVQLANRFSRRSTTKDRSHL